MIGSAANWRLSVDRGPDWLIVKIQPTTESEYATQELADQLWAMLVQHFTYRLVLEMEEVDLMASPLVGQLIALHRKIGEQGGTLRLCGLSERCEDSLRLCRLRAHLATHENRLEAVLGHPMLPR